MPNTADLSGPAVRQSRTETIGRPYVLFEDGRDRGRALLFDAPKEIIVARDASEVARAFARMEAASRAGLHLAGYASYELGYALEPKFAASPSPESRTPLLLFGAFAAPRAVNQDFGADLPESRISLEPAWTSRGIRREIPKVPRLYFRRRRLSDQPDLSALRALRGRAARALPRPAQAPAGRLWRGRGPGRRDDRVAVAGSVFRGASRRRRASAPVR